MFITIKGVQNYEKSTVIKLILSRLQKENYPIILTREPGGVKIAEEIRNIILDKENTSLDDRTEALLFAASRRQHLVEKVWPALKENKIVLCDRYIDSSLAYQGGGKHLGVDEVLNVNLFATENTLPDLTILFDLETSIGHERINKNKNREVNRLHLESLKFYDYVRNTFLELSKKYKDRYVVIDASKTLDEVVENVYSIIKKRLDGLH